MFASRVLLQRGSLRRWRRQWIQWICNVVKLNVISITELETMTTDSIAKGEDVDDEQHAAKHPTLGDRGGVEEEWLCE